MINNKKSMELTMNTIATMLIIIVVILVVIIFFSKYYGSNSDAVINIGNSTIKGLIAQ